MGDLADDLSDRLDAADLSEGLDGFDECWRRPLPRHPDVAPGVWVDQSGRAHLIDEMATVHLRNVLNWLTRMGRAFAVRPATICGRVRLGYLKRAARRRGLTESKGRWASQ